MSEFDIWLRQQVLVPYLHSIHGIVKAAAVIIVEIAELVEHTKTGIQLKACEAPAT